MLTDSTILFAILATVIVLLGREKLPGRLVVGPVGDKSGDYWKLGFPCMIWFFIMAVFFMPLIWRF